ncbi:MAG: hypothetical protein JNK43_08580 [Ignavibacteria bacterium]|nr:hypothetical protein [Ignavibacteria bacterium]
MKEKNMSTSPNNAPKLLRYIAFGMLFASVILVILGVYYYQKEDKFLAQCQLITCKVTSIEEKRFGKAYVTLTEVNGNYKPWVHYVEYDPTEEDLGFEEGEIREVYYYTKDPAQSQVKGFFENHLTSFILLIVGFTFMLDFPILLMVTSKITKQRREKGQFGIKDDVISE